MTTRYKKFLMKTILRLAALSTKKAREVPDGARVIVPYEKEKDTQLLMEKVRMRQELLSRSKLRRT